MGFLVYGSESKKKVLVVFAVKLGDLFKFFLFQIRG